MSEQESKKRRKKRPVDLNRMAFSITQDATQGEFSVETEKNLRAVELGRLGGLKVGLARAKKLTAEERSEIARKAAEARWRKRKK